MRNRGGAVPHMAKVVKEREKKDGWGQESA